MRNLSKKQRVVGGAVTLFVLGVVGLVYAAWTATGTGSGYAKAGSAQALNTVDVSATTPATLYPGSNGNVLIRINNPNPYPVSVTDITGNGAITPDAGHAAGAPPPVSPSPTRPVSTSTSRPQARRRPR